MGTLFVSADEAIRGDDGLEDAHVFEQVRMPADIHRLDVAIRGNER